MQRHVIITSLGGHRHIQVGELAALHHGWSDEMYFYLSKIFLYKEGFSNFLLWDLHIFVQGSGRRSPNFSRPAWHMSIDTKVDGIRCAKMKLIFWLVVKKEDIGSRILKCYWWYVTKVALQRFVWPWAKKIAMVHDSYTCKVWKQTSKTKFKVLTS